MMDRVLVHAVDHNMRMLKEVPTEFSMYLNKVFNKESTSRQNMRRMAREKQAYQVQKDLKMVTVKQKALSACSFA